MSKQNRTDNQSRREFLKGAAVAGGAVAVVAATGSQVMAAAEEEKTEKKDSSGYRETQHIRDYYRTADL